MRTTSIMRLSSKKFFNNFSNTVSTLITITLLSMVIMTLCNLGYYYKINTDADIINYNKENGIEVALYVETDKL